MPFLQGLCASHVPKTSGTGTWVRTLIAAWMLSASLSAAAESVWKPLQGPKKIVPDESWGPAFSRGGTRMTADKDGNLYLTLGDSLHIRDAYGGTWRTAPRKGAHFLGDHPSLAVGANGMVVWGTAASADKGRNWANLGQGRIGYPSALGILANGNILAGGSYDAIDLSVDSGRTWKSVHMGRTFGSIMGIASGPEGGWAWAAPMGDRLLLSRDHGQTWANADSVVPGAGPDGFAAQYLAPTRTDNAMYAYQHSHQGKGRIVEFNWTAEACEAKIYPLAKSFPDSTVTALEWSRIVMFTQEHGLWAGTWGQGVWLSPDGGTTWVPRNKGLGDLRVEAIASAADGSVYALTRDGLFTIAGSTAIRSAPQLQARAAGSGRSGPYFRLGNGSEVSNPVENLFRADGRAARIPSTDQRPAVGAP